MSLPHDLRLALRGLARRPGYATIALLTIGVGIAANTAIFSAVRGVLLRPLPYAHPDRIVTLKQKNARTGFYVSVSIPNYRDWGRAMRSFATYGAEAGWGWVLTGRGQAELVRGPAILGQFFETLGAKPYLGRLIPAAETEPGSPRNVVLSYGFWLRHFGADSSVVGQTLTLDQQPYTVVGVLPRGWGWPNASQDVYVPMGTLPGLPFNDRGSGFGTRAIARLAPGVSLQQARDEMSRVGRAVAATVGDDAEIPELHTAKEFFVGDVTTPLLALMGGVAFVLLIAVANVANLQLARGEERRREIAVRAALGAGRSRLMRQLLIESLVLSGGGGVLGIALAFVGVRALIPLLPAGVPADLLARIGIDPVVLAFATGLSVLAGVVFGLVPALRAASADPVHEIKADLRTTPRHGRLRTTLVAAEVALAMVLLIGAGLMIRSFGALRSVDKGFDASNLLTTRLALPPTYDDSTRWTAFYDQLLTRLRAAPGVGHAAVSLLTPLSDRSWELRAIPEGTPITQANGNSFLFNAVSDDYFRTLGVPVLAGRTFTRDDRLNAPAVAVVDERMARRFWPGESALGKRVFLGDRGAGSAPIYRTVVGVVKNVRHYTLQKPSRIEAYVPYAQAHRAWGTALSVFTKTAGDPTAAAPTVRHVIGALDQDVPVYGTRTMQSLVDDALSSNRAMERLFALFGAVALALAGLGIFGVMSYTVAQRTRELGIRMALGADRRRVLRTVLGRGLAVTLLGVAVGVGLAPPLTRLVRGLLYDVAPFDPAIYAGLAFFLVAVAALAAYLPARRATLVDPAVVLKEE